MVILPSHTHTHTRPTEAISSSLLPDQARRPTCQASLCPAVGLGPQPRDALLSCFPPKQLLFPSCGHLAQDPARGRMGWQEGARVDSMGTREVEPNWGGPVLL